MSEKLQTLNRARCGTQLPSTYEAAAAAAACAAKFEATAMVAGVLLQSYVRVSFNHTRRLWHVAPFRESVGAKVNRFDEAPDAA